MLNSIVIKVSLRELTRKKVCELGTSIYKGGTTKHYSISDNIGILKLNYKYSKGYFGDKGQGRDFTRNISSSNPVKTAKEFYDTASKGGIETTYSKGKYTKLSDGTIISYRETSSSDGTSVVEINIRQSSNSAGVKFQKIHFVEGD